MINTSTNSSKWLKNYFFISDGVKVRENNLIFFNLKSILYIKFLH